MYSLRLFGEGLASGGAGNFAQRRRASSLIQTGTKLSTVLKVLGITLDTLLMI